MTPLALVAELADYPGPGFAASLRAWPQLPADVSPVVQDLLRAFAEGAGALSPEQLEEAYAAAFDLQPDCTLNLGHHLFGEDWKRSSLLIELAPLLQQAGLGLGGELPDHLCWLLRWLAQAPNSEEARELAACVVLPGVRALRGRLAPDHLYQPLLQAVELLAAERAQAPVAA
ncbi:MAG: nitrate reductase molybdenum cofactor assembly chaperone [Terriglobales bacterium]